MEVFSYAGLVEKLNQEVALFNTWMLHLFQNNHTPAPGDVVGAYTEADFTGYSSQPITDFGAAFLNGSNQAETDSGTYTFVATGALPANDIYGYYVTDGGGSLMYAERYASAPFTIDAVGKFFAVQLVVTLINQ